MSTAIEAINVNKEFQGNVVVSHVNLAIPKGTIYGIVGANGAGKTTLLRILHGVIWPTSGEIKVLGETVPKDSADIRQHVHLVTTDGQMYASFRVEDLVRYARWLYDNWDEERCQRLLDALQLPRRRLIRHLSLGMRMQLRLVIHLSAHPDILLLDEPTNGLDPVLKRQFLQLILDEAIQDGTTVVMATHNLSDLERIADGLAVMYQGRIVAHGLLDDLKNQIRSYQAVLPNGLPAAVADSGLLLQSESRGSVWTITAEDPESQIEQILRNTASHVETIPLNLEEVFTQLLQKEGYARDTILLA